MGKSSPKPPPPPDPVAIAEAQARANRIAQFTPQGSLLYGRVGADGGFAFDPTLSEAASMVIETPFQRAIREARERIGQTLADQALHQATGLSNAPPLPTDFDALRQHVEEASFSRALALLNPEFERQERRLRQSLANRGQPIAPGTAGGDEFGRYQEAAHRAREDAALAAVLQGGSEADRQFARAAAARQQQFNELAALLGAQQIAPIALPAFAAAPPVDVIGAQALAQQNRLAAYNASSQQARQTQQGLFGLAGAALPTVLSFL